MIFNSKNDGNETMRTAEEIDLTLDPVLEQTLNDFRSSVYAWSDAALARPRTVAAVHRSLWRLAAGWALVGVLAVGVVSGGIYQRLHQGRPDQAHMTPPPPPPQQEAKSAAPAQETARQAPSTEQRIRAAEALLAKIDKDVSRHAPSAMEPLIDLMRDHTTASNTAEEEELLAKVNSEVSRQVPSAMEPLVKLMTDVDSQ